MIDLLPRCKRGSKSLYLSKAIEKQTDDKKRFLLMLINGTGGNKARGLSRLYLLLHIDPLFYPGNLCVSPTGFLVTGLTSTVCCGISLLYRISYNSIEKAVKRTSRLISTERREKRMMGTFPRR